MAEEKKTKITQTTTGKPPSEGVWIANLTDNRVTVTDMTMEEIKKLETLLGIEIHAFRTKEAAESYLHTETAPSFVFTGITKKLLMLEEHEIRELEELLQIDRKRDICVFKEFKDAENYQESAKSLSNNLTRAMQQMIDREHVKKKGPSTEELYTADYVWNVQLLTRLMVSIQHSGVDMPALITKLYAL